MARILSGKEFAARIKEDAARGVAELKAAGVLPRLAVIIVGSDPASEVYVRNKQRTCEELGIRSDHIALPAETTKEELLACIEELNVDPEVHGILVQLPLPAQIAEDEEEILSHIDPRKDVDGFHPVNVGHLVLGAPGLRPCTPAGCIRMLDYAGIPIEGAHAAISATLGPLVGTVFAVGLLASGLASTSVGAYAGSEIMNGLLHIRVPIMVRRLISLIPALIILGAGAEPTWALVVSQVALSFGIPFAIIPLMRLTASTEVMGDYANNRPLRATGFLIAAVIVALNLFLVYLTLTGQG